MIEAGQFVGRARERGFDLYAGVPCSYLKPFINYVIDADDLTYVGAANEGDAVAIAAGAELGGSRGVVMLQNSGLGNTVNPLTSLTETFRIPVMIIVTLRGEPDGAPDEPQHELMGRITTDMLDLMGVRWAWFPECEDDVESALDAAVAHLDAERRPFAFVMRKGSVAKHALETSHAVHEIGFDNPPRVPPAATRSELLRAVQSAVTADDIVVATTGYTGRELYALDDRPNQIYMVGSMGCASSLGLGLAIARPERRVIVLEGDGAALMRLGALATIGYQRPRNLVHVLLDNGLHESTGGQSTVSASIDFARIASACGYASVAAVALPADLAAHVASAGTELTFLHVPMLPGIPADLPRPTITPAEVADRLRRHIQQAGASDIAMGGT